VRWKGRGWGGSRYRTLSGVVAGFFAVAALFVGTVPGKVTRLLAFLASHLVHILGFLDHVSIPAQYTTTKPGGGSTAPVHRKQEMGRVGG
jgi:hypothetical protein